MRVRPEPLCFVWTARCRVEIRSWVTDLCHRLVSLVVVKTMAENANLWSNFCGGYGSFIAKSHMCFEKPLL